MQGKTYQNCTRSQWCSCFWTIACVMEGRIDFRDGYATISADGSNLTLSSERQALSLQSFVVNLSKRHD